MTLPLSLQLWLMTLHSQAPGLPPNNKKYLPLMNSNGNWLYQSICKIIETELSKNWLTFPRIQNFTFYPGTNNFTGRSNAHLWSHRLIIILYHANYYGCFDNMCPWRHSQIVYVPIYLQHFAWHCKCMEQCSNSLYVYQVTPLFSL